MFDASPYGNTFTVTPITGVDPNAAYRVQAQLEQRIAQSLNPAIQLVPQGGVYVGGEVLAYSYQEQVLTSSETCTRSETYRDSQGRSQSRTVSYHCTRLTRMGDARIALRFYVTLAQTGQVVFDRVYEDGDQRQTTSVDTQPGYIDGGYLLSRMLDEIVDQFAHVILPWPDGVVVAFTGCGGADGCGEAFDRIRANDLAAAEAIYTRILGPYDASAGAAVDPEDVDIVAETLFNRGIVRAYTGSYELGMADLQRAIELKPDQDRWRVELARIETLAAEQDQLRQQIESGASPNTP